MQRLGDALTAATVSLGGGTVIANYGDLASDVGVFLGGSAAAGSFVLTIIARIKENKGKKGNE